MTTTFCPGLRFIFFLTSSGITIWYFEETVTTPKDYPVQQRSHRYIILLTSLSRINPKRQAWPRSAPVAGLTGTMTFIARAGAYVEQWYEAKPASSEPDVRCLVVA
jgi:hypothetical protein